MLKYIRLDDVTDYIRWFISSKKGGDGLKHFTFIQPWLTGKIYLKWCFPSKQYMEILSVAGNFPINSRRVEVYYGWMVNKIHTKNCGQIFNLSKILTRSYKCGKLIQWDHWQCKQDGSGRWSKIKKRKKT